MTIGTEPTLTTEEMADWVKDPGRIILRGKFWTFTNVKWNRAEPDVGIMSDYPDSFDLEDEHGNLWDWSKEQLTDEEDKVVNECLGVINHEDYGDE